MRFISRWTFGSLPPGAYPGHTYQVTGWYQTDASVRFVAYYRTDTGVDVPAAVEPVDAIERMVAHIRNNRTAPRQRQSGLGGLVCSVQWPPRHG